MDITASNLDILFRGFNLSYQNALTTTPVWYSDVATTIPSASREITYGWLERLPIMRQWLGPRVVNAVTSHSRTIVNKPYEMTYALDKWDVADDQYGLFNFAMVDAGMQAAKWPDQQIASWITNTTSTSGGVGATITNGYDGVPQFATNHPLLGGDVVGPAAGGLGGNLSTPTTQSNLLASTALTYSNFISAWQTMAAWVGADGQPLGIIPDTLMVPPQLAGQGKLIVNSEFVVTTSPGTGPTTNVWKGSVNLKIVPELAGKPNAWYLLCTTRAVKPFLWQLRQAPLLVPRISPTDPAVFENHQFLYGVEARGCAAETLWFLSLCATSDASF
jgi:phage major head subunit gpT-like protein